MRLRFVGLFADAGELWRANRDLLVRVAGVFFFLPFLAVQLFVPTPQSSPNMPPEQALRILQDWYFGNWYWMLAATVVQIFGEGALFALLLGQDRPKLDAALGRAFRLLPTLLLASFAAGLMVIAGFFALILPGLYLTGRTLLTGAVVMGESQANPFAAIAAGIRRTRNNGWVLLLATLLVSFVMLLASNILGDAERALASVPYAGLGISLLTAGVAAAGGLAQLLIQAAAYRALVAKQGI